MIGAVHYMVTRVGVALDEALRMAALYPAQAMGIEAEYGHLRRGARADFTVITGDASSVRQTFTFGQQTFTI